MGDQVRADRKERAYLRKTRGLYYSEYEKGSRDRCPTHLVGSGEAVRLTPEVHNMYGSQYHALSYPFTAGQSLIRLICVGMVDSFLQSFIHASLQDD